MAQFSFPILENDELLDCLDEMELSLDPAQLTKPTYEVVKPLFEQALINLSGITREDLLQPVFTAMDALEYPELHDESIPVFNFYRHLSRMLLSCGVKDFSWRDIYKPDPVKLRRYLSAIVNFAKFREEKLASYQESQTVVERLLREQKTAQEEHAAKMAELKKIRSGQALEQQEVDKMNAEIQEIVTQLQALTKQSIALGSEVKALTKQSNNVADQASQSKFDLIALRQEADKLSDQIVQSPEKQQAAIFDLQRETECRREVLAERHNTLRNLERRVEDVTKSDREVRRCIKLAEQLDGDVAAKKAASREVKDLSAKINEAQRRRSVMESTAAHLRRQHATLMEKRTRMEHQAQLRMEAVVSQVEEQRKVKEAVEAENAAIDAKHAEGEAMIRGIKDKMHELQHQHDVTIKGVLDKYTVLRKAVSDYNASLEGVIDSASFPDARA